MEQQVYNVAAGETKIIFDLVRSGDMRSSIIVNLNGVGAQGFVYGIFLGKDSDNFAINHAVVHNAPDTKSEILVKGIITGSAQVSYDSLVKMNKDVHRAEGHQKEDTLVLSKDARIHSVPNLEIAHNDVKCSHSVSTTNIDKEKLFYMSARGIKTDEAIRELARGHLFPVLDKISQENKKEEVLRFVEELF